MIGISGTGFNPPRWLRGPHGQTMIGRVLRIRPQLVSRRVRWETPDGDFIDLDIVDPDGPPQGSVLILHGLEGSSTRSYVTLTLLHLRALGFRGIAMNFRSCSGETNRRARFYHSGETGDLAFVAARLASESTLPLGAIGFSLGGNVLLKGLGETGSHSRFKAAVVVSVPFDLAAGARLIGAGAAGRIYTHYFLRSLKAKLKAKARVNHGADGIEPELLRAGLGARSLLAYDDAVTAPLHGFRDAAHYYAASSSADWISAIRTPTLALHAADDPFLPEACLPQRAFGENGLTTLHVTPRGGHLGFLEVRGDQPAHARLGLGCWVERTAAAAIANFLGSAGAP